MTSSPSSSIFTPFPHPTPSFLQHWYSSTPHKSLLSTLHLPTDIATPLPSPSPSPLNHHPSFPSFLTDSISHWETEKKSLSALTPQMPHKSPLLLSFPSYISYAFIATHQHLSSIVNTSVSPSPSSLPFRHVIFVMGNESCDMDSMVSSITLAFYLFTNQNDEHFPYKDIGIPTSSSASSSPPLPLLIVPLLNVRREDFPLRSDVKHLFSSQNIPLSSLLFYDEYKNTLQSLLSSASSSSSSSPLPFSLILVDHNCLCPSQSFLFPSVISVFDHHQDDNFPYSPHQMIIKNIKLQCGSCCSLVSDYILRTSPSFFPFFFSPSLTLSNMIISTLLMDTSNFSPMAKKAEDVDRSVLSTLRDLKDNHLYQLLSFLKVDISTLTTEQILLKDSKIYTSIAKNNNQIPNPPIKILISSIPILFEKILKQNFDSYQKDRKSFLSDIYQYVQNEKLNGIVLMTSGGNEKDGIKRQIGVIVDKEQKVNVEWEGEGKSNREYKNRKLYDVMMEFLHSSTDLKMEEITSSLFPSFDISTSPFDMSMSNQLIAKSTRKQVAPIINSLLAKL